MLRLSIRVCIDGRALNAVLGGCTTDSSITSEGSIRYFKKVMGTYRAISPRFAISIELSGVMRGLSSAREELFLQKSTFGLARRSLRVVEALRMND